MSGRSRPTIRTRQSGGHVLAVCGGIGGAKLALGLYRVLPPHGLTVVVNTGDDFVHLGLHVSPDLDTVLYTLAGWSDPVRGWGRADEAWQFMEALEALGGPAWFRLGDRDLAMHALRTQWLQQGETLTAFARHVAGAHGDRGAHPADVRRSGAHDGRYESKDRSRSRTISSRCAANRR